MSTRGVVKWSGTTLCLLLVALWVASVWWVVAWRMSDRLVVGMHAGRVVAMNVVQPGYPSWDARPNNGATQWWFEGSLSKGFWIVWIPLWVPFLLVAMATAVPWRDDFLAYRRRAAGCCSSSSSCPWQ